MKKIQILILFNLLILAGCSSGDSDTLPLEPTPSTAEPTDLFIVNMTLTRGNTRIVISHGFKVTLMGNSNYDLGDKTIFSVLGGNYNSDGTFPNKDKDMPLHNSRFEERSNHIISFIMSDETNANAKITVNTAFTFGSSGDNLWGDGILKITDGIFTISALENHLNDVVPPLGKTKNGVANTSVKFTGVGIDRRNYGNIVSKFGFSEWTSLLREQGKVIFIRTFEGAIDAGEGEPQFYQPPL